MNAPRPAAPKPHPPRWDSLGSSATTVEDAVFYNAVGTVAIVGLVSWPTAALLGTGQAQHQRARNVIRGGAFSEAREGLIEAVDEAL